MDLTGRAPPGDGMRIRVGDFSVRIAGPIDTEDVAGLGDRVCAALDATTDPGPIVCDLAGLGPADAATVDLVARLALAGRRLGRSVLLRDAPIALLDLLAFCGLAEAGALLLEPEREAEEREDAIHVQEERDPLDPPV